MKSKRPRAQGANYVHATGVWGSATKCGLPHELDHGSRRLTSLWKAGTLDPSDDIDAPTVSGRQRGRGHQGLNGAASSHPHVQRAPAGRVGTCSPLALAASLAERCGE